MRARPGKADRNSGPYSMIGSSNTSRTSAKPGLHRAVWLLALIVFVAVPAWLTFRAPISTIRLERGPQGVDAFVTVRYLLVLPFRTEQLAGLTGVGSARNDTYLGGGELFLQS